MKLIKTKFKDLVIYKKTLSKIKEAILESFIYKNILVINFLLM